MEYHSQDQDQDQDQDQGQEQDRDQEHQDQNQSSNPPPFLDKRCTDLPFLLHALYHLEPNPQTSRARQKAYDQSQWHAIPRETLQILTVISQLFATTGNSECEEDGEGVGWEKIADLAAGNTKLKEFVDSRKGYEDMEVEVVDEPGEWVRVEVNRRRRIYCFPEDDMLPFNRQFQHSPSEFRNEPVQEDVRNENMDWEYISNDEAPPRALTSALRRLMPTKMSGAERGRFFRALRQGLISFLGAIRSKDFRETDNDKLWEYMRVADLIYKKRTELEPLVKFTDEQMEWVNKIARYPRAAEFIIRRAYTPQYQKMLSNLEIHELIPKAPDPPDQSLPPPQTTVLEILEWIERKYAGPPYRLLISPPSIKLKYPNADPRAIWTPNPPPDKHCVHPEVAIINFIYNYGIYNFNTPYVVYGISGFKNLQIWEAFG
ncbi:hypothetical protein TWF173_007111 [Orbilia oligospora]|nr:hypothetical protein TWF173_007111 [Orbilia oligospora]